MSDEQKLAILIDALKQIIANDPGPAYYIAKGALQDIEED